MTTETVFANARIVAGGETIEGSLLVVDGAIAEIASGPSHVPGAIDLDGDFLLPGFVELHTDNLEKHFSPRPGVSWPSVPAVLAHDAQIAAAGITTVFDSLAVGDLHRGSSRLVHLEKMIEALAATRHGDVLRAEHLIHLRCEVSHEDVVAIFERYVDEADVRLVSLMDHTPGQRQFTRMDKYREYFKGKYGFTDGELETFVAEKIESQKLYSAVHRETLVRECRRRGITLASHDDATPEHVDEAISDGVTVAEFPTTLDAARRAHDAGLGVLMGAPNMVLGGSHSGNVSAMDLAREGVLDILSSDYVPSSMVQAVFRLWQDGAAASLPDAVATVSKTPARLAGLGDRGEIAPGKRADLVRIALNDRTPVIVSTWRAGRRII
ncbi:MAG: alpha-D-ribose 1-methylphosphonate 5-triphosphate diphosphatase [Rhodospirillaceae bacterium]